MRTLPSRLSTGLVASYRSVLASAVVLALLWQTVVTITDVPAFIIPTPLAVLSSLHEHFSALLYHTGVTSLEILVGLLLGTACGVLSAVLLATVKGARRWALPLMVASQSLPVFALAPILTLWLGYGLASKIAMATLIIYFPVVAAAFDGLRHTSTTMLDLAQTLNATRWSVLMQIRLLAAAPSIASGIRVATSVALIGAVVGEWVGSSRGLGYYMLQANARMQTDEMFAALLCLSVVAVALYAIVNALLDSCLYWQSDSTLPN